MVSIAYIVKSALSHDTLMSWAVRRALGVTARPRPARRAELAPEPEPGRIDPDLMYCFRNERPVMDGVHR